MAEVLVSVQYLRGKTTYEFNMDPNLTLGDLQQMLAEKTNVRVDRQKLLGLKTAKNKTATHAPETRIGDFLLTKNKVSCQLMGTPDKEGLAPPPTTSPTSVSATPITAKANTKPVKEPTQKDFGMVQKQSQPQQNIIIQDGNTDVFLKINDEVELVHKTIAINQDLTLMQLKQNEEILMRKLLQLDQMDNLSQTARDDRKKLIVRIQSVLDVIDERKNGF